MDTLDGKLLMNKKGFLVQASDLLKSQRLVVYIFSDDDSPDIRLLLGKLQEIYKERQIKDLRLEIIHVSLAATELEMLSHFSKHGDWYALEFGDPTISELIFKYDIVHKPCVMVVKSDSGDIVAYNADLEIKNLGLNVLIRWFEYNC